MSFTKKVSPAKNKTPSLNIGCLMDYSTGVPKTGAKGETLIDGGLHPTTGVTGEPNSAKTGNSLRQMLVALVRYNVADATTYDTENTLPQERISQTAEQAAPDLLYTDDEIISDDDIDDTSVKRHAFTNLTKYPNGDKFFGEFKEYGQTRPRLKADLFETPFLDSAAKPITMLAPSIVFIDSFSMFNTTGVKDLQDKADIGSSGRNIEAMRDNMAKNQMMLELPGLCAQNGLYFIMTAHLGKQHQMDPHAPPRKQLSFLKNDLKLKNVPEKFNFLVHNLWYFFSMKPLINKSTKKPEYPRETDVDSQVGDTDLQIITCMNLRGKSGKSGLPFDILLSQTDGILDSLTEFHHCKKNERFGIGGNNTTYYLELMPEVSLGRTTVRRKLAEDDKLKVATRMTADLLQIKQEWSFIPQDLWCEPKVLYEDLKAMGYDWDKLYQTRGYWTFDQYTNPIPYLSTMDLLYMRKGLYIPYWYDKKELKSNGQPAKTNTGTTGSK